MSTSLARWALAISLPASLLCATKAHAHFVLLYPPSRGVTLESAPCGAAGSTRGTTATVLRPGQTIVVRWEVQVDHLEPPKFRLAFDDAGQDFPTPVGPSDTSALPLFLDGILTPGGGVQTQEIALPNIECDNCTLQMLQYLNPKPPYTARDFYYQCADITLSAGTPAVVDAGGGDGDAGGDSDALDSGAPAAARGVSGCRLAGGARTEPPAGAAAMVALLALVRRRPRPRTPEEAPPRDAGARGTT